MRNATLACSVLLSLCCSLGDARPVPVLSYAELQQKAQLVLIVRPGETRDAAHGDPLIELDRTDAAQYLTACVTPLKVLAVLKGTYAPDALVLPHYRMDWSKAEKNGVHGLGNGPSLVNFLRPQSEVQEFDDTPSSRDCIVFLVEHGGTYDFVTGQFDSSFSVFRFEPASVKRGEQ